MRTRCIVHQTVQTLIKIVVGIVILGLSLTAAAFLLPGSYHVERSIEIQAPADKVFTQINDLKHWQSWTVWASQDPEMSYETSPVSAGVGAWQKWTGPKSGTGEMELTASEPPTRVSYTLYFPEFDSRSTGDVLIEPAAQGVKVTWTNGGPLGSNPLMRWMGLMFDRILGGDFESGLERLKRTSEAGVPIPSAVVEAPVAPAMPPAPPLAEAAAESVAPSEPALPSE
jgi:uncharacterized protein YndB with AHSA1/START domain